ncbi:hypothetical protein DENSPDRAFT_500107 [Dentipellis sp. KUC8613]|nr:hypothetical protein DENSPDRAFT_500107 [Dentipellis sp. KUC8613]
MDAISVLSTAWVNELLLSHSSPWSYLDASRDLAMYPCSKKKCTGVTARAVLQYPGDSLLGFLGCDWLIDLDPAQPPTRKFRMENSIRSCAAGKMKRLLSTQGPSRSCAERSTPNVPFCRHARAISVRVPSYSRCGNTIATLLPRSPSTPPRAMRNRRLSSNPRSAAPPSRASQISISYYLYTPT